MALATYANLKSAVASWLKRTDLTSTIPDFITLAELRIFRDLRVRVMETSATLTCSAGTATVALPTNFRQFRWLYVDGDPKQKLELASGEQLYQTYAGSTQGKPRVYSTQGGFLLLGPTPDAAYDIKCLYYKAPDSLSDSTTTNTAFPRFADAYLFASLVEAFTFTEDEANVAIWEGRYQRAIADAMKEDAMDRHSGTVLRARTDNGNP